MRFQNQFHVLMPFHVRIRGNPRIPGHFGMNDPGEDKDKYDTNGDKVWERRYDGRVGGDDSAAALALDAMGNVYVTGSSMGMNESEYLTIKYEQE